jgi:hypothetical protein
VFQISRGIPDRTAGDHGSYPFRLRMSLESA